MLRLSEREHQRLVETSYRAGLRPADYVRHVVRAAADLVPPTAPERAR